MLKGKTVIVTGAAKGIGKAIAVAFAKEGCKLFLIITAACQMKQSRKSKIAVLNVCRFRAM